MRRQLARLARFLHLRRLAAFLQPPVTPWWFRRPIGYFENFATGGEVVPPESTECRSCGEVSSASRLCSCWTALGAVPEFDDVLLSQMRYRDVQKRDKLTEEVFANPSPDMAGRAVEELRWMENEGRRA